MNKGMKLPARRLSDEDRKSRPGYIREFKKDYCEICGGRENLHVHHKDRDHLNNKLENLQTLCRSCHYRTHKEEGHFAKERPSMTCTACGVKTNRGSMCRKHAERNRIYGDPHITKIRVGKYEYKICRAQD